MHGRPAFVTGEERSVPMLAAGGGDACQKASVRDQHLPCDERGVFRQKTDAPGDLLRSAEPFQRRFVRECAQGVLAVAGVHIGIDNAWRHRIHADMRGSKLLCQRLGKTDDRRLGGGVGSLARGARYPPHRGDVDNGTAALGDHFSCRRL